MNIVIISFPFGTQCKGVDMEFITIILNVLVLKLSLCSCI